MARGNRAADTLLIAGHTLYKTTAAIAFGADIVPGTNVTKTTLADELAAIRALITT